MAFNIKKLLKVRSAILFFIISLFFFAVHAQSGADTVVVHVENESFYVPRSNLDDFFGRYSGGVYPRADSAVWDGAYIHIYYNIRRPVDTVVFLSRKTFPRSTAIYFNRCIRKAGNWGEEIKRQLVEENFSIRRVNRVRENGREVLYLSGEYSPRNEAEGLLSYTNTGDNKGLYGYARLSLTGLMAGSDGADFSYDGSEAMKKLYVAYRYRYIGGSPVGFRTELLQLKIPNEFSVRWENYLTYRSRLWTAHAGYFSSQRNAETIEGWITGIRFHSTRHSISLSSLMYATGNFSEIFEWGAEFQWAWIRKKSEIKFDVKGNKMFHAHTNIFQKNVSWYNRDLMMQKEINRYWDAGLEWGRIFSDQHKTEWFVFSRFYGIFSAESGVISYLLPGTGIKIYQNLTNTFLYGAYPIPLTQSPENQKLMFIIRQIYRW